jgi:hypothetical protein
MGGEILKSPYFMLPVVVIEWEFIVTGDCAL